jgi:GAF domain-containing protein
VGRAASSGEATLVPNVDEVPGFIRNPLLPKTQAELAVPIRSGEAVLGVLDAQSEEIGGFDQEDLTLMQAIADQVAVALDNARLFAEAQAAVAEAEGLARQLTRDVWQDVEQKVDTTGYVFTKSGITPDETEWLPVMGRAVQQKELVSLGDSNGGGIGQTDTSVAIPLTLRNEVVGVIGLERSGDRAWTEDELATIQNIAEQAALALDAARLTRETERAAWRDRVVSEATAHVWASSEIEEVMRTAVAELGDKLNASEVVIRLGAGSGMDKEDKSQ